MALLSRCASIKSVRVGDGESSGRLKKKKMIRKEMNSYDESSNCSFTLLTVWRKSLVFSCHGFTVFDSIGNLVYRVDNYRGDRTEDIVLMDARGKPHHTLHREAEDRDGKPKKPIYCGRKNRNLLQQRSPNVLAYVFGESDGKMEKKGFGLVIQGSYERRSCEVIDDESGEVVAEIKKKDANIKGISFGLDVFHLIVRPGFNPAFAMSLVLLLDQSYASLHYAAIP
ncbi:protein LURP-one-related 17-like [Macadamia integrifolia]|uniref:protein LURP-one-related 17-like n=1 Tax=Macadamia integrifolia TaxID=60698 RepID=UPI001C5297DB|nr:protein LURP-one-related 17-like [Macadamia integrifolia]